MTYLFCALAVYKVVQLADAFSPKEAMPWVKVLFGVLVSYGFCMFLSVPDKWLSGFIVATLAGAVHGILRLITLLGDLAVRKAIK